MITFDYHTVYSETPCDKCKKFAVTITIKKLVEIEEHHFCTNCAEDLIFYRDRGNGNF